jgi:hypothetical protein
MKQTIAVSNLSRSRFAVGSVDLFDFDPKNKGELVLLSKAMNMKSEHWIEAVALLIEYAFFQFKFTSIIRKIGTKCSAPHLLPNLDSK